ncbi:MAG TPA: Rrf2 family transcriptional regulator [candidate division Zixibacteria bacterium]|nr:Rrf2 family transcriptional regulator [candidate division Zixibacteria bacterium]
MDKLINISEAALIAVHALAEIAGFSDCACSENADSAKECLSTQQLAERMGISSNHLSKVLQALQRKGLIRSVRGPTGGYCLAKPASEINFREVIEIIDGPLPTVNCIFRSSKCNRGECIFGDMISSVNTIITDTLSKTALSNFRAKEVTSG